MWWKLALLPLVLITIFAIFYFPPPQSQLGDISRIIFFHVPVAWVAVIGFLISMINSIKYLRTRDLAFDIKAVASARLGFVFCVLAATSGAVWAKVSWGSFWNWDPRESTIFVLVLIYGAYFALRSAIGIEQRKAAFSAVYSILAFLTVPFLVFIVPRSYQSLHPNVSIINQSAKLEMSGTALTLLILCILNMTLLFAWTYSIEIRLLKKLHQLRQKEQNAS